MAQHDWNQAYVTGDAPWDTGAPDEHLVEFLRSGAVGRGRALDVGCGTGTNALWLAGQGFSVVGIDIAPAGLEKARAKADGAALDCRFAVADFLRDTIPGGPFDLVFDRGCFHVFDEAEDRARFAHQVASLLKPGGLWLSLIASTEGPAREFGPPRRSARDVVAAIEPELEIVELRATELRADLPMRPAAWFCVCRARQTSAQPSTKRP